MDIAGPELKEFHTQMAAIEAEIAETPEDEKIVGLHPAALREYGRHVEQLQSVFSDGVTPDLAEAAGKIRNLVARVTLMPQENGFKMELEGRLALLMQAPRLYPNMRIAASGGIGGSGGGT